MTLETIFTNTGTQGQTIELQVDHKANLYVNGEKVVVEKKVSFNCYEKILATITTIAIAVQAIIGYLNYNNNHQNQLPKMEASSTSTPIPK